MSECTLRGQTYRCDKLATPDAYHLGFKLLPFILQGGGIPGADWQAMIGMAGMLATLPVAEQDTFRDILLANVRWKQGDRWVPLRAPGGALLNSEADRLDVQLRLMGEVLYATFFDFDIGILLPSTPPNGQDTTAPVQVAEAIPN